MVQGDTGRGAWCADCRAWPRLARGKQIQTENGHVQEKGRKLRAALRGQKVKNTSLLSLGWLPRWQGRKVSNAYVFGADCSRRSKRARPTYGSKGKPSGLGSKRQARKGRRSVRAGGKEKSLAGATPVWKGKARPAGLGLPSAWQPGLLLLGLLRPGSLACCCGPSPESIWASF